METRQWMENLKVKQNYLAQDGIKLIKKRGYYMQHLLPNENFEMAAVIGLDSSKIEEVCKQIEKTGKFIVPANYNCKIQTVISGEESAINEATAKLKELGAKRVIPLKTSGPFHTKKLEKAKEEYSKELDKITFNKGNVNYYSENENFKQILAEHIVNPVRFDKTIELMKNENVDEYVEIGPGKALTGFVRKDIKEAKTYNINNLETLENYLKEEI